jgi:hypothetical protein
MKNINLLLKLKYSFQAFIPLVSKEGRPVSLSNEESRFYAVSLSKLIRELNYEYNHWMRVYLLCDHLHSKNSPRC